MSAKINFISILSNNNEVRIDEAPIGTPAFFTDLNLDQIIGAVTAGHEANQLLPIFSTPLRTSDAIRYRQEVFRDLEDETLVESIGTFVGRMSEHRRCMGLWERASQRQHAAGWFLEAVKIYCHAVSTLRDDLQRRQIASRGLTAFRLYLGEYEASHTFTKLREDTERTAAALARAKYCLLIRDNSITVRRYEGEEDYAAEVEAVFARFKQGAEAYVLRDSLNITQSDDIYLYQTVTRTKIQSSSGGGGGGFSTGSRGGTSYGGRGGKF